MEIALINDACHSGKFLEFSGEGKISGVAYDADWDQAAFQYATATHKGGVLTVELSRRLEAEVGCQLDGKGGGIRDLVLDLREWTWGLGRGKLMNQGADIYVASQTMGENIKTSNDLIRTLPIHSYTGSECGRYQSIQSRQWEELGDLSTINLENTAQLQSLINMEKSMSKLTQGETYLEKL